MSLLHDDLFWENLNSEEELKKVIEILSSCAAGYKWIQDKDIKEHVFLGSREAVRFMFFQKRIKECEHLTPSFIKKVCVPLIEHGAVELAVDVILYGGNSYYYEVINAIKSAKKEADFFEYMFYFMWDGKILVTNSYKIIRLIADLEIHRDYLVELNEAIREYEKGCSCEELWEDELIRNVLKNRINLI